VCWTTKCDGGKSKESEMRATQGKWTDMDGLAAAADGAQPSHLSFGCAARQRKNSAEELKQLN